MRLDIEVLRIISAFGIVWFHSGIGIGHEIAYGGLITFLILSTYFAMISDKGGVLSRVSRLLVPCLIWSAIYAAFGFLRGVDNFPQNINLVSKILTTPSIHLWFLPFVFVLTFSIDTLKKHITKNTIGIFSALISSFLILTAPIWREFSFVSPFGQWAHALPAALMGMFLGGADKNNRGLFNMLLLIVSLSIVFVTILDVKDFGLTYLAGFAPCLIILSPASLLKNNKVILTISSATYGIYLLHVLALFILRHIGLVGFLLPITTFAVSLFFIILTKMVLPKPILKYVI